MIICHAPDHVDDLIAPAVELGFGPRRPPRGTG
jgi:hypothetical protein